MSDWFARDELQPLVPLPPSGANGYLLLPLCIHEDSIVDFQTALTWGALKTGQFAKVMEPYLNALSNATDDCDISCGCDFCEVLEELLEQPTLEAFLGALALKIIECCTIIPPEWDDVLLGYEEEIGMDCEELRACLADMLNQAPSEERVIDAGWTPGSSVLEEIACEFAHSLMDALTDFRDKNVAALSDELATAGVLAAVIVAILVAFTAPLSVPFVIGVASAILLSGSAGLQAALDDDIIQEIGCLAYNTYIDYGGWTETAHDEFANEAISTWMPQNLLTGQIIAGFCEWATYKGFLNLPVAYPQSGTLDCSACDTEVYGDYEFGAPVGFAFTTPSAGSGTWTGATIQVPDGKVMVGLIVMGMSWYEDPNVNAFFDFRGIASGYQPYFPWSTVPFAEGNFGGSAPQFTDLTAFADWCDYFGVDNSTSDFTLLATGPTSVELSGWYQLMPPSVMVSLVVRPIYYIVP